MTTINLRYSSFINVSTSSRDKQLKNLVNFILSSSTTKSGVSKEMLVQLGSCSTCRWLTPVCVQVQAQEVPTGVQEELSSGEDW